MNEKKTLNEIHWEVQALLEKQYDHETGEVDEEVEKRLDQLGLDREAKIINTVKFIKNSLPRIESLKAQKKVWESEVKRIGAMIKKAEEYNDWLKANIVYKMEESEIIEGEGQRIRRGKPSKSVEFIDKDRIPMAYYSLEKKFDKASIKQDLEAGKEVEGAIIQTKPRLSF